MKTFEDKVAAITGAGSGIGRALALLLAERRCHLALCDIDEEAVRKTADAASRLGVRVTTARVDVADRDAVYAWADATAREHGKVNLIFNNAGVALTATLEGVSYDDFDWLMGINFWGVVYGTKAFLPHLRASGDGHVVNISSLFGLLTVPTQGVYNASKFAVRGFTDALRQELVFGQAPVSATCVHPGGIRTNIAKASRIDSKLPASRREMEALADKLFMTTPRQAATQILDAVRDDRARVLVGPDAKVLDLVVRLTPTGTQRAIGALTRLLGS